ncbi:MAG: hypothetical protein ABH864_06525 [archaeon]
MVLLFFGRGVFRMNNRESQNVRDFAENIFRGCTHNALLAEAGKGCSKEVFEKRVCLEPAFERFDPSRVYRHGDCFRSAVFDDGKVGGWCVFGLRLPLVDELDWDLFGGVLCGLSAFGGVASFEVVGNSGGVCFLAGSSDEELAGVLRGQLVGGVPGLVAVEKSDPFRCVDVSRLVVFDLFPSMPWYRRLSVGGLGGLKDFCRIISGLSEDEFGFFQVLFVPVRNDWHFGVKALLKAEDLLGGRCPFGKSSAGMVKDLSRPFFAVAVRFGCSSTNKEVVSALRVFCGSFVLGGRPFQFRSEKDFIGKVGIEGLQSMLSDRVVFCPGFVLDAGELAGFVHFPDKSVLSCGVRLEVAKGFRVPSALINCGRPLGINKGLGVDVLVCLPDSLNNRGAWLLGRARSGKSTSLEHEFCWHASRGECVFLLDPHRVTAEKVIGLLPESCVERSAFFDFDADDFVLQFNPFCEEREELFGRLSVEFVSVLKTLFDASHFYRMSHLLSRAVYALFVLKKNLSTIPVLFSRGAEGDRLRREVVSRTSNAEVRRFWKSEFYSYPREAFTPIINRLSSLFLDAKALRIFSSEKNAVDVAGFMREGWSVSVALPSSYDLCVTVGGMLSAQVRNEGLFRAGKPNLRPCFLMIDEFYRIGGARLVESLINECVKGQLHTVLANQETGQLDEDLLKAVLSVPNIFVLNVNLNDAKRIAPVFNGRVSVDDIISLRTGEVFGSIHGDVVDFKGLSPLEGFSAELRDRVVGLSRERFYVPREKTVKPRRSGRREFDSF